MRRRRVVHGQAAAVVTEVGDDITIDFDPREWEEPTREEPPELVRALRARCTPVLGAPVSP